MKYNNFQSDLKLFLDFVYQEKDIPKVPHGKIPNLFDGIFYSFKLKSVRLFNSALIELIQKFKNDGDFSELSFLSRVALKRFSLHRLPFLNSLDQARFIDVAYNLHVWVCRFFCENFPAKSISDSVKKCLTSSARKLVSSNTKRVVLMMVTHNYLPNLEIWLKCAQMSNQTTEKILLLCLDDCADESTKICEKYPLFIDVLPLNVPNLNKVGNGRDLSFIWFYKIYSTLELARNGVDVAYTDLDSFWVGDVSNMLDNFDTDGDIWFMPSDNMPLVSYFRFGFTCGCGFYFVRGNEGSVLFLEDWLKMTGMMLDDQIAVYQILVENDVLWLNSEYKYSNKCALYNSSHSAHSTSIVLLSDKHARRVKSLDDLDKVSIKPVLIHPRWILDPKSGSEDYFTALDSFINP